MTNQIFIYHHNDADGICAAAMIHLAYPNATKRFFSSSYPFKLDTGHLEFITDPDQVTIFMVDLSLTYDAFQELLTSDVFGRVNKVIWIDHHKTSIDSITRNHTPYPKNFDTYVKESACGALLTYEYIHPHDLPTPTFLRAIDMYDRHAGSPEEIRWATNLNLSLLSIYDLSPISDIWRDLLAGGDTVLQYQTEQGEIIHKYLDEENRKLIRSKAVLTSVFGMDCVMVNASSSSILFDSIADKYPLRLAWTFDGEQYKYTIYSNGSINCEKIAAKYGGGGHPGAAGFSSDQLLFVDQVKGRLF